MTADSIPGTGGAAPGGTVTSAPPPPDDETGPVLGFRELSERVVASAFDRYPWLHRVLMGMLAVCTGTCVVAVVSRLSPLPLLPVPLFLLSGYALWHARAARGRRQLVNRVLLAALAALVGFWLISIVGRWVA